MKAGPHIADTFARWFFGLENDKTWQTSHVWSKMMSSRGLNSWQHGRHCRRAHSLGGLTFPEAMKGYETNTTVKRSQNTFPLDQWCGCWDNGWPDVTEVMFVLLRGKHKFLRSNRTEESTLAWWKTNKRWSKNVRKELESEEVCRRIKVGVIGSSQILLLWNSVMWWQFKWLPI